MSKWQHRIYVGIFYLIALGSVSTILYYGYEYYTAPLEERFYLEIHNDLKPTGFWGHGFGFVGASMMLFGVSIYMIRKRVRKFTGLGALKYWLEFHIFLCSLGPILVLFHTTFKFGGLVAVSFWSMVAVVASGVIGRFIYVQIPRTMMGRQLTMSDLSKENNRLSNELKMEYGISDSLILKVENFVDSKQYKNMSLPSVPFILLRDFFKIRSASRTIGDDLMREGVNKEDVKEVQKISKSKLLLARRMGLLQTMQNLFRYWHILHLPFAIVMLIIALIHVYVAFAFGYTWIF